jgi:hypothetical protein
MTHLAARSVAASTVHADRDIRAMEAWRSGSGPDSFALLVPPQNFLENAFATAHTDVMGAGDAARPAGNRPSAFDCKSRSTLDIRVALSISRQAEGKRVYRSSTYALTGRRHAYGRKFTVDADLIERTMLGYRGIENARHRRFGENIHAKYRKSAAVAPILHDCVPEGCALHSDPAHDGGWVASRDRDTTPNERSGR